MKLESIVLIQAPPAVVFRFFCHLDHLRFVCTDRRQEWSPQTGRVQSQGSCHEVRLRQGRHEIRLNFKTVQMQTDVLLEDEFVSWPLRGAKRTLEFEATGTATRVREINIWTPPRFVRQAVKSRSDEQQGLCDQKMDNGKRLVEAAFKARGDLAFTDGVIEEAQALGVQPVVPL